MKKQIIIVASVILVIIVAATAYFVFGGSGSSGGPSGPSGSLGEQSMGNITGGVPSSEIPPGETIVLGSSRGSVTVKNFYKTAIAIIEETEVVLMKNDMFEIDYSKTDSSFTITILKGPVSASRANAEGQLLSILGVAHAAACRLQVSVVVPVSVDAQTGGRSYPLSFCAI